MKAVLYSLWHKELKKVHGDVEDDKPRISGATTQDPCCNFYERQINGKYDRKTVSPFEGVIYNKCLWLTKENDELARNTFIEYEQNCINDLEKRIEAHKKLIDILGNKEIKTMKKSHYEQFKEMSLNDMAATCLDTIAEWLNKSGNF